VRPLLPGAHLPGGRSGGANAALFAVSILALLDSGYAAKLAAYREKMRAGVLEKNERLRRQGYRAYMQSVEGQK
jgi:phosphoribosylcarboxyaminoimidazole (NCAIR) mutase